jgi:hypothetical protein
MGMSPTTRAGLTMQGFACDVDPRVVSAARWLRFTPALSTIWIALGTALRSPILLWSFAVIAALGAAGWHVFDALFDVLVRPAVKSSPLPPNPPPRRFAMAIAAAWSAGAGALMAAGFTLTGVVAGSMLALAGATVATTHFCLGSWFYHQILRR